MISSLFSSIFGRSSAPEAAVGEGEGDKNVEGTAGDGAAGTSGSVSVQELQARTEKASTTLHKLREARAPVGDPAVVECMRELEDVKSSSVLKLQECSESEQDDPEVVAAVAVIAGILKTIVGVLSSGVVETEEVDLKDNAKKENAKEESATEESSKPRESSPADREAEPLVVYIGVQPETFDAHTFVWTMFLREEDPRASAKRVSDEQSLSPSHSPQSPQSPFVLNSTSSHRRVEKVRYTVQYADCEKTFEPADFLLKKTSSLNSCCGVLVEIFARPQPTSANAEAQEAAEGDSKRKLVEQRDNSKDFDRGELKIFYVTLSIAPGAALETRHTFYFDGQSRPTEEPVRPSKTGVALAKHTSIKPSISELFSTLQRHNLSPTILSPSLWVLPNSGVFANSMTFNQCFWISLNHWFMVCRQQTFSLRELKRTASLFGSLPIPTDLEQTDLVAHHKALKNIAQKLKVLVRVYMYDKRRRKLFTPAEPCVFREELDLGEPALVEDPQRWIVVVHYGNHFELVYRSDQLSYRLDRLHFDAGEGGRRPFEFATDSSRTFWDVDGKQKTAAELSPQMQRQIMDQYIRGEGGASSVRVARAGSQQAGREVL
eukprot:INCI2276.1.p1 GENE.INCI2276.1~~INCI2276.1.p1  ORF type:complete len:604 (-),score=113.35 INCI2276.1:46-1857(-)